MDFNIEKVNDVTIVELTTEALDASNAKEFKSDIMPVLKENKNVVFDMNQVKFLDSSGCGSLLSCLRTLNSVDGDLKICGLHKTVQSLFELVRMHLIIEIFGLLGLGTKKIE